MDVQMPDMDGYETARLIRMRDESEHTPIIFITAHSTEDDEDPDRVRERRRRLHLRADRPGHPAREGLDLRRAVSSSRARWSAPSAQFRDSEARTRSVLENVADGIVTVSGDGMIQSFNRAAAELFGYDEEEAIGQPFSMMVGPKYPADYASDAEAKRQLLAPAGRQRSLRRVGRPPQGRLDVPDGARPERRGAASGTIHIGCLRDISERQTYTDALQHQALHDNLTGLPNRVLFGDRVEHAIQAALRTGESLALLVMDLDEFKQVNDTLGHQHGDELLKLVTERLVGCLRTGDTVARLGGDEFGILPREGTDLAGAATVVWKIQQALEPSFVVNGHAVDVEASIGITLAPDHGDNVDDLLRRADLAMYDAKRAGTGYALFAAEQEETPARRLALLGDLRRCIEREELVLHYQPKVDLATQETVGVEALLRWNHPSGRLFMPDEFMPEVERSELMIPMTEWVIERGAAPAAAVARGGLRPDDGGQPRRALPRRGHRAVRDDRRAHRKWGVPPDRLTLELTESALIDTAVPGMLAQLRDMDERLSIDDFGTGYSSLVYLQRLPVVEIKADSSFVMTMCSVKDDAVIVRSIIDLAHNLGVKVVAEGVEDEATMDLLNEYGCDDAQGYYFSRPMPGDELLAWLETSPFGLPRRLGAPEAPAPADEPARVIARPARSQLG